MGQGSLRWSVVALLLVAQGCASDTKSPATAPNLPQVRTQSPPSQSETLSLLSSNQFTDLDRRFSAIQAGYRNGTVTDQELRADFRVFYSADATLESKYDAWIVQFPRSYVAHLARAIYYKKVGQERRGGDYIGNTTAEQLRGMEVAFGKASQDLRASVALDDKPLLTYFHAMDIPRYLGGATEVRELLELSNKVDRDNLIVREKYMTTLEPRWGGSVEQMYAFLDESRKAGLPPARLQLLEAVIVVDRANGHKEDGDYAAAERDYREAIAMGNEDCLPCFGEVLILEKKYEDAIPVFSKVLESNPADINSRVSRGRAYMETGKIREGLTDLTATAASGDGYSENQLGELNMTGIPGILPPNPDAAMNWFREAAAHGNSDAIQTLKNFLAYRAAHNPQGGTASPSAPPPN
jgi:tetratricopeptide (TPR) repeat protein